MNITPDQAKTLLDGTTPGPWEMLHTEWEDEEGTKCEMWSVCDESDALMDTGPQREDHDPEANLNLAAAAPDLAQTVAWMEWQWGVERAYRSGTETAVLWFSSEDDARQEIENPHRQHGNPRLVRRLVGPVEVAE